MFYTRKRMQQKGSLPLPQRIMKCIKSAFKVKVIVYRRPSYTFFTHRCYIAAFGSLCNHSHIPIVLTRLLCALCWNRKTCHVHKLHKYPHSLFVCTLQVCFLLSPFPIVSVAVWITVFACFYHCFRLFLSLFESISINYETRVLVAKLFCI